MKKLMMMKLLTCFIALGLPCVVVAQESGDVFRKFEADVSKAVDRGFEYLISVEQKDGTFPGGHGLSLIHI